MIDKNKEYQTRDGREVRIYATDGNRSFPVHGAIRESDGWSFASWTCTGDHDISCGESEHDLIEKPKVIKGWINIYPDLNVFNIHPTKADADSVGPRGRIACIQVEFKEGEGL